MYYFMLGVLPLPIPPKSLEIKIPSMNKTLTLINDGEINIPKKVGLREISFDFLLPTFQKYPFAMYQIGDYTAATIILYLKVWRKLRIPIPFIVVRMSPKGKFMYFTSILCLIEDITYIEDAEEYGFDTNCSIKLKEYNPYGTKRVEYDKSNNTATVQNERSTADRQKKSEIKPKEGETLNSAAKREGYNPSDVRTANGIGSPSISDQTLAELETMDLSEEIPDGMLPSEYIGQQIGEGEMLPGAVQANEMLKNMGVSPLEAANSAGGVYQAPVTSGATQDITVDFLTDPWSAFQ